MQSREEILRLVVMDRDPVGTDDFEGKCTIPLRDLRDQMKHDEWFNLEPEVPGTPWQGRVGLLFVINLFADPPRDAVDLLSCGVHDKLLAALGRDTH